MNETQKEDIGKVMKNALYIQQYAKKHCSGESEWKNQACSLSLSYACLKASKQSVENSIKTFCSNFLKVFEVNFFPAPLSSRTENICRAPMHPSHTFCT